MRKRPNDISRHLHMDSRNQALEYGQNVQTMYNRIHTRRPSQKPTPQEDKGKGMQEDKGKKKELKGASKKKEVAKNMESQDKEEVEGETGRLTKSQKGKEVAQMPVHADTVRRSQRVKFPIDAVIVAEMKKEAAKCKGKRSVKFEDIPANASMEETYLKAQYMQFFKNQYAVTRDKR